VRIELSDLPPAYRAQAAKKLLEQREKNPSSGTPHPSRFACHLPQRGRLSEGENVALREKFDSRGEYEFYMGTVLPKLATGEIVRCEQHPRFVLFPAGEYGGLALREIRYTADFRLDYPDGTVEIVEVKSKFVRKMQRDYPVRRRVFLEKYARPAGWIFKEIITADSRDEIKQWKALRVPPSQEGKTL
jgi:hypothetical protein